jgi:hypothetical protein
MPVISEIIAVAELQEIAEFLQDDDVTRALGLVLRLSEQHPNPNTVVKLITELQAKSFTFKMKAKYYMILEKGGDSAKKKNLYLSMSDALDRVVDSLKYVAKAVT